MARVLKLDEIKSLVDIPQLVQDIEAGFVLYSEGRVKVPPVGFLHFEDPPGDVHITYGFVIGDDYYAVKTRGVAELRYTMLYGKSQIS